MSVRILTIEGFRPRKPAAGRIHVFCPTCGQKTSNVERADYDPPRADVAVIYCGKDDRCGAGGWIEGAVAYFTVDLLPVDYCEGLA